MMPSVQGYEERMNLRSFFARDSWNIPQTPLPQQFMFGQLGEKDGKKGMFQWNSLFIGIHLGFPYVEIFLLKVRKLFFSKLHRFSTQYLEPHGHLFIVTVVEKLDDEQNLYLEIVWKSPFPSFSNRLALGLKVSVCFFRCVWFWGSWVVVPSDSLWQRSRFTLGIRGRLLPQNSRKDPGGDWQEGGTTEISPKMCMINRSYIAFFKGNTQTQRPKKPTHTHSYVVELGIDKQNIWKIFEKITWISDPKWGLLDLIKKEHSVRPWKSPAP